MSNDFIFEILGYLGSGCLSIMMIPQVYHTIKTKKTDDISIKFLLFNLLAVCFLIPYSIHFKLYPILSANFSVFICNSIILYYAISNRINQREVN
tara:strand:+ start:716 stop:1000 length:285 start_codon:yes stop_codon:yes gene_type:complete